MRVPGAAALPARLDARSARTQRALGAALVELMRWFLDHRSEATPQELDARFHAMVWRGVPGPVRPVPR